MTRRMLGPSFLALVFLVTAGPTPASAQGPKVLRVATDTNLPWLDPHMGTAFTLRELSSHLFEGLVTIGEDFGVLPQLAESWTVSPNGLDYTFKLRSGVKFHNGRTVTADDVKAPSPSATRSSGRQRSPSSGSERSRRRRASATSWPTPACSSATRPG